MNTSFYLQYLFSVYNSINPSGTKDFNIYGYGIVIDRIIVLNKREDLDPEPYPKYIMADSDPGGPE
jgi:hypothetical protein